MSLPKYLHSGMTGAPSLMGANGSVNALLLACLVNGFNTKTPTSASSSGSVVSLVYATDPGFEVGSTITISGATNALFNGDFRVITTGTTVTAANTLGPSGAVAGTLSTKYAALGWTRPYSGTNIGCYRQGGTSATKRFWRVRDNTITVDSNAYIRGYENMTAVSTGTGPFPTVAQVAGDGAGWFGSTNSGGPIAWKIIGTPRFFYIFSAVAGPTDPDLSIFASGASIYGTCAGELADVVTGDTYAHVCPGGGYGPMATWHAARAHTGAGTSTTVNTYGIAGVGTGLGAPAPDPSGDIRFSPAPLVFNTVVRGFLPGALGTYNRGIFDGLFTEGQILTGVAGVSGRLMVVRNNYIGDGKDEYALLLDEDWGDV